MGGKRTGLHEELSVGTKKAKSRLQSEMDTEHLRTATQGVYPAIVSTDMLQLLRGASPRGE